jgi:uncharacterized protein YegL
MAQNNERRRNQRRRSYVPISFLLTTGTPGFTENNLQKTRYNSASQ